MMATTKDYRLLAEAIRGEGLAIRLRAFNSRGIVSDILIESISNAQHRRTVNAIANALHTDNPRFDYTAFNAACGLVLESSSDV